MKKYQLFICFLLTAGIGFGQAKQNATAKQPASELKKILTGTGLPVKIINDNLAVIPYEGANVASYNVMVQKVSDLYIIYTDLTEVLAGKIDETKFKYLLEQNNHFDIIKIGLNGDDNAMYLRADIYKANATTALLTRIIKQVANVTNIVAGDLKK